MTSVFSDLPEPTRQQLIEREAEQCAIAAEFGVTEWEAFLGIAERNLIARGQITELGQSV